MLEFYSLIDIIRSIILIIAAILIVITAIGILRLKDEMDKVIYVRIHMLGVMDIASVLALIGLNQPLLACIYFILAPFLAHAMANAYYHGEDTAEYEINDDTDNLNSETEDKA
ncbi:MAG: cation:proton antiporter [Methanobrevibacter sp.]|nr:cation:proton antiporter [Methanobrevibacter sp.]